MPEIDNNSLILRFRSASVPVEDLQAALSATLAELRDPESELARAAAGSGIKSEEFLALEGSVTQKGKGFGDVIVVVAILAPALNHSLRDVWDDLVWPQIKSLLGADAVGAEVADDDSDDAAE
jgi:hypothetical protein